MFSSNNQWILVGLTSYGRGCAHSDYSGVYTRIAAYEDWINSNMNGGASNSSSSTSVILIFYADNNFDDHKGSTFITCKCYINMDIQYFLLLCSSFD